MRLLNTYTLVINDYQGIIPPYAILSHTWNEDEVTYLDFVQGTVASRKGYVKITGCCKQAIADGFDLVWIDTCCIDKRSSAELSEAINSMFNWYRNSAICYALLEDVDAGDEPRDANSKFAQSRWFTRGWTLQELLAPARVLFFASNWTCLGTRHELVSVVAAATNISEMFFRYGNLSNFSVAQKMSWASNRRTTRVEDEAYCLLGLFGVNMPLLYGEGSRAFIRLQEEIMKRSDDESLFAWAPSPGVGKVDGKLLAPSPALFSKSGSVRRSKSLVSCCSTYSMTNRGLQISLPMINPEAGFAFQPGSQTGSFSSRSHPIISITPTGELAVLNCEFENNSTSKVAISLEQNLSHGTYIRRNHYLGLIPVRKAEAKQKASIKDLLIQVHNASSENHLWSGQDERELVWIQPLPNIASGFKLSETVPTTSWTYQESGEILLQLPRRVTDDRLGEIILIFKHPGGDAILVIMGELSGGFKVSLAFSRGVQRENVENFMKGHITLEMWRRTWEDRLDGGMCLFVCIKETKYAIQVQLLEHDKDGSKTMETPESGFLGRKRKGAFLKAAA